MAEPSEMVAQVARGIGAAMDHWKAANGGDDASCIDMPEELIARAAIMAMREPSTAMVAAAGDVVVGIDHEFPTPDSTSLAIWRAMIATALGEGEP